MNLTLRHSSGVNQSVNDHTFDITTFRNRINTPNKRFRISLEHFAFENAIADPPQSLYIQLIGLNASNSWSIEGNISQPDRTLMILNSSFYQDKFVFYPNSKLGCPVVSVLPSNLTVSFQAYVDNVLRPMTIEDNSYILKIRIEPFEDDEE